MLSRPGATVCSQQRPQAPACACGTLLAGHSCWLATAAAACSCDQRVLLGSQQEPCRQLDWPQPPAWAAPCMPSSHHARPCLRAAGAACFCHNCLNPLALSLPLTRLHHVTAVPPKLLHSSSRMVLLVLRRAFLHAWRETCHASAAQQQARRCKPSGSKSSGNSIRPLSTAVLSTSGLTITSSTPTAATPPPQARALPV